ncbi:MAG: LLM class flavin-dependent oxidoreductase [Polyangiaceae bacterium]
MKRRRSVLDLSPIASGSTPHDALMATIDLAVAAESLGYCRYWVAEHHNAASVASSAPEIMIGQIAARTKTMRVGAGGIMLPNHSPLKVAELFRVLSALFPNRIDLGLGRAAGTDPRTGLLLRRGKPLESGDEFASELAELRRYLGPDPLPRPRFARSTIAVPAGVTPPALWLLGSSDYGGRLAASLGLPFAFAAHMNPADAAHELTTYRRAFRASDVSPEPQAIVSLAVICADSDAAARRLASSAELGWIRFAEGQRDEPMPSVAEALAHEDDEQQAAIREMFRERLLVGSPSTVRSRIDEIASACEADEVMVMTHVHDPEDRKRSYALLADALG